MTSFKQLLAALVCISSLPCAYSQSNTSIPTCATSCLIQATSSQPCGVTDSACLCLHSAEVQSSAQQCLTASNACSPTDLQIAVTYYTNQCKLLDYAVDSSSSGTVTSLATVAIVTASGSPTFSPTTATATPTATQTAISKPNNSTLSIPAISGIAAGSAFFLAILITSAIFLYIRRQSRQDINNNGIDAEKPFSPDYNPHRGANFHARPQLRSDALAISTASVPKTQDLERVDTDTTLVPLPPPPPRAHILSDPYREPASPDPTLINKSFSFDRDRHLLDNDSDKKSFSEATDSDASSSVSTFRCHEEDSPKDSYFPSQITSTHPYMHHRSESQWSDTTSVYSPPEEQPNPLSADELPPQQRMNPLGQNPSPREQQFHFDFGLPHAGGEREAGRETWRLGLEGLDFGLDFEDDEKKESDVQSEEQDDHDSVAFT